MCAHDTNKIMHQKLTVMDFLGGKGTEMLPQTEYLSRETEELGIKPRPDGQTILLPGFYPWFCSHSEALLVV